MFNHVTKEMLAQEVRDLLNDRLRREKMAERARRQLNGRRKVSEVCNRHFRSPGRGGEKGDMACRLKGPVTRRGFYHLT